MRRATAYNLWGHAERRERRGGSIYAVVLALAILVSLIGLSAVAVGRLNLRTAAAGGDSITADLLALSAIEHATTTVNTQSAWRSTYTHDTEIPRIALGDGSFTWKLCDETDGSLSSGGVQPVRVYGYGRAGDARRGFSVQLVPRGSNLLVNGDTESGTSNWVSRPTASCTIETHTDSPFAHSGSRYLWVTNRADRTSGIAQDVTPKVSSGKTYFVEMWVRKASSSGPDDYPYVYLTVTKTGVDTPFRFKGGVISDKEWTRITGTITPTWSTAPDAVTFHIETAGDNWDVLIDDLRLVESGSTTPMAPALDTWRQETVP